MRNEIKLSLKDAREREERNRGENTADWWEECHHTQDNFGAAYDVHPTHKPGWHRAPDLAMLKSHPVDPPRERDIAKLTEAAKRKEAPFVDWNGPSSDPCLKYAGIGGGGHASPPASGSGNLPDAAPAPAPVADSGIRCWFGHDECNQTSEIIEAIVEVDGVATYHNRDGESGESPYQGWDNQFPAALSEALAWLESHGHAQVAAEMRAKERKNVAARAWKNGNGERWVSELNSYYYGSAGWWTDYERDSGVPDRLATFGFTEIHDPAEIQRLVAELHAAGLGK